MLELRSVAKRIGAFEIHEVSLRIPEGEYFVLLGPSGVGKTVLIELIAGIAKPDSGSIIWRGRDVTNDPPETRRFAVVYQDCALFPHMTVEKNLAYGLRRRPGEQAHRLEELALRYGIAHLLHRRPEGLSRGEQQRVAIARAVVGEPELLLLDEPFASLDPNSRMRFRTEIKRIRSDPAGGNEQRKLTILHVTHDLEEAMSLGDRVGMMLDGTIRQCGSPQELFRKPSSREVADFLGMRNVFAVTYVREGVCKAGGLEIYAAEAVEPVSHVWIRPEEIVLSTNRFESSARNQFWGRVIDWDYSGPLIAVRVACGGLILSALITHASFEQLRLESGSEVCVTFKSSSVHTF